jgi:hypothetical protein
MNNTQQEIIKYIFDITGIKEEEAESLNKYLAKLPLLLRMETYNAQIRAVKDCEGDPDYDPFFHTEYAYAQHLVAIRELRRLEMQQLNEQANSEDKAKLKKIRIERVKAGRGKKGSKKAKLIKETLFHEIKNMYYKEGLSWREIADFIAKYHKTRISHGYLQQKFNEAFLVEKYKGEIS